MPAKSRDLHLIKIFDPAYYQAGVPVRITKGEHSFYGLIQDNEDDFIKVIHIADIIEEGGKLGNEVLKTGISVSELESGEYIIDFITKKKNNIISIQAEQLNKIYRTFKDLSELLCNHEHTVADSNGLEDQSDIDARHIERIQNFKKLLQILLGKEGENANGDE